MSVIVTPTAMPEINRIMLFHRLAVRSVPTLSEETVALTAAPADVLFALVAVALEAEPWEAGLLPGQLGQGVGGTVEYQVLLLEGGAARFPARPARGQPTGRARCRA